MNAKMLKIKDENENNRQDLIIGENNDINKNNEMESEKECNNKNENIG